MYRVFFSFKYLIDPICLYYIKLDLYAQSEVSGPVVLLKLNLTLMVPFEQNNLLRETLYGGGLEVDMNFILNSILNSIVV